MAQMDAVLEKQIKQCTCVAYVSHSTEWTSASLGMAGQARAHVYIYIYICNYKLYVYSYQCNKLRN